MAFQDGLSAFLSNWSGVHTAFSFNQTNANSGTDTSHDANSSSYAQADTDNYPNYALSAYCGPDANGDMDIYIITDACMLLYLPSSGYTADRTYGLFHNGGGTHAQSGWLRYITGTGWQLCINHNTSKTVREEVYYTLGEISGWFCIGFQYEDNSGNIGLWVDGVNVAETARSTSMTYGSGNPYIGRANGREPTQWSGSDYNINGTGILIANFVCDNPNNDNSNPAGCGDSFYTDYYDEHIVVGYDALVAETGGFALNGITTGLLADRSLSASPNQSFVLTGNTTNLNKGFNLTASVGTFVLTGIANSFLKTYNLPAEVNSFVLSGISNGLFRGLLLTADTDSFTLNGIANSFARGYSLPAETDSFTLSGIANDLLISRLLSAVTDSFGLTGIDVTLTYTPVGGYNLVCELGTFTLTGIQGDLLVSKILSGALGEFTLSGIDSGLEGGFKLSANVDAFTLTGVDINLLKSNLLSGTVGSFTLTGIDTDLIYTSGYFLACNLGTFSFIGNDVTFKKPAVLYRWSGSEWLQIEGINLLS